MFTDMSVYWERDDTRLIFVGVYVDDPLVTATASLLIDMLFADLNNFFLWKIWVLPINSWECELITMMKMVTTSTRK